MLAAMARQLEPATQRVGRRSADEPEQSTDAAPSGTGGARRSSTGRRRSSPSAGTTPRARPSSARRNHLGKGALYYYIGSKERAARRHPRPGDGRGARSAPTASRQQGGSPTEQLAMLGTELLDVIARYPDHVWVFLHEFPALTGDNATQFRTRRREYEAPRRSACSRPASSRATSATLDPKLTARAWLGMHNYTYLWLKAGGSSPRRRSPTGSPTSSSAASPPDRDLPHRRGPDRAATCRHACTDQYNRRVVGIRRVADDHRSDVSPSTN